MSEFYGIEPGSIPGFAEVGAGRFMGVGNLPEDTVQHMLAFMDKLRGMYRDDELAFEICIRHVASVIEDKRREEGQDDPREEPDSLLVSSSPWPRWPLQYGAARCYFEGGDTPAVEHDEPSAVPAPEDALVVRQALDDVLHGLIPGAASLVVGDVQVLAADEADAQYDLRHGHAP
jgi:hypothetical protein